MYINIYDIYIYEAMNRDKSATTNVKYKCPYPPRQPRPSSPLVQL